MYKLYKGDCLEVMKNIKDQSVDLILCDLPYGTTDCSWDTIIPFDKLWEQYDRIIKPDGVVALFSSQPFTNTLTNSNVKDYKYTWYWIKNNKTGFCFAKYQPMRQVEEIHIFYKKNRYYPQGLVEIKDPKTRSRKKENDGVYDKAGTMCKEYTQKFTGYPSNVLYFDKEPSSIAVHPTQKPIPLLEYLVKTYTKEGDVVLDNCMGSGSTGVACVKNNRDFIGIELTDKFYEISKKRIEGTCIK